MAASPVSVSCFPPAQLRPGFRPRGLDPLSQFHRAALQAGHALSLTPVTDANGKATVRTSIATGGSLQLAAGNDLTIRQAQVKADGNLIAAAGHDLNVTSVLGDSRTVTDQTRQGKTKVVTTTTTQDIDQQALTAGGNLVLSAGHDVNLTAAKLDAGNGLAVVAGNDLNSTTLTTVDSSTTLETRKRFKQTTSTRDETVHGTEFTAGGDIALQSGHDVNLTAANLFTDKGALAVSAGNDVNLLTAQEQHDVVQDMQKKKTGFLSSKTTTTHDEWHDSTAVATTLSGVTVQIAAGHDLLSQGAQVAGTGNVVVAAGNDLTLETAQNTHSEEHDKKVKKTGLYSGGGFSVTLGASKQTNTLDTTEVSQSGSLVGSTDGSVTLTAGNAVAITGSDVLSKAGTAIVGKDVTIAAVENRVDTVQTSKQQSAGITLGLTGGLVDAAQTAYGAVKRGSDVDDDRLKALYAAKAGYAIGDAAGLASNGLKGYNGEAVAGNMTRTGEASADGAQGAANATGVSLRIGIGASSSSSKTTTHEETTGGSRILSDGNVTIAATGCDLNVIGSKIAGDNVALAAANNLNLLSQQETNTTKSENKNAGGEIGVSVGATTGYYLTVSAGKGNAKGNSNLHTESVVTANDTLTLASGNDTTIKGAQAIGDTVLAKVGGDLLIQSEQDTNDYKSKQQQASLTLATGSGSGGSYSQQKVNSSYTSVKEQSGIQAGNGGFDITVGGDTHLIGGAIASTADAEKNRLSTNGLTVEDLQNKAEYKSSGVSVGGGTGSSMVSVAARTGLSMLGNSSDNSSSTTKSDIAAGMVEVRNGDTAALSGLDRKATELQQSGLKEIFDEKKLAEQKELAAVAGEVGFRVAGDVAVAMQHKAQTDLAQAQAAGDQAGIDDALSRLASWGDGGTAKTLLHGVTGAAVAALGGGDALSGAVGAAVSEKAKQAMFDYLLAQGLSPNDPTFKSVMELGSAALGGLVGQQTGASTALAGEQFNRQLHPIELSFIAAKADDYAAYAGISEKEAVQLLINATLDQVDNDAQQRTRSKDAATYQAAANWLANEAANVNLGFVNEKGQSQQAFTATISQFYDSTLFDGPYRGTIFTKLTDKVLGTNWTGTFSISNDKYLSTAADLKLEGQYQEWRATRPADVSKWSDEDLNTMVGFVHKNDLRKMAQLGIFGPPGATWVSLADGDYKTVVNDAAINFATSVVPVGSVGRSLEHIGESSLDVADGIKLGSKLGLPPKKPVQELEVDSYINLKSREVVGDGLEHDHIPSFAALRLAKETELGRPLTKAESKLLYQNATAVEVPREVHVAGETYGGKNTFEQVQRDASDLCGAVCRNTNALRENLLKRGYDPAVVDQAVNKIVERNRDAGVIK
ncbi:hemagglutinin repeat-containing protein [Xanthomonas sacchari]|uniref:hemagglutinin repeat-containing protein n=1 Tax=Xanthomonas sacchari TaxID=56458 RepID=UPI00225081A3|nr:hemagglutinin repeat-containing protein [Xanthomonas sacchari]